MDKVNTIGIQIINMRIDKETKPEKWLEKLKESAFIKQAIKLFKLSIHHDKYYIQSYDSFGDGWNGNILTIIDSESNEVLNYTLEEGSEGASESFTVEPTGCSLIGDVNQDGTVIVIDIVSIVNGILSTDTADLMLCGDFNQDGQLNVIDIVGIVNTILGS